MNHHYVPQYFFRRFSRDSRSIEGLLLKDGTHISRASIRGQASRTGFYGNDDIEAAFAQADAHHSRLFAEVDSMASASELTFDQRFLLCSFIVFQHERTSARRARMSDAHSRLTMEMMRVQILNDHDNPQRQVLLDSLDSLRVDPYPLHMMSIAQALASATLLLDLRVCLLRNRTTLPFCFADAPVVYCNPFLANVRERGVLGLQVPGFQAHVPISPEAALLFFDGNIYDGACASGVVDVSARPDVVHLNKLQLHHAQEVVYFRNPKDHAKVRRLWRQERGHAGSLDARVEVRLGYDRAGQSVSEVMHMFDPQPSFLPSLSFVNFTPLPAAEFRFAVRSPELVEEYLDRTRTLFDPQARNPTIRRRLATNMGHAVANLVSWLRRFVRSFRMAA